MLSSYARPLTLVTASAAILLASLFTAHADDKKFPPHGKTNINLAVASNFYGVPPSNSAITDLINAFEAGSPKYTVTVVDNGATSHIINGNSLKVDLFLAADTETPQDLLVNHFSLVAPYNASFTPPLYTFNYATGILAFLSNTPEWMSPARRAPVATIPMCIKQWLSPTRALHPMGWQLKQY